MEFERYDRYAANGIGYEYALVPVVDNKEGYQGDTSHRTQGNGLGLAMAQKIAALHGGAVTVDSRPGSGSCFTVALK